MNFADRLLDAIDRKGTPAIVGIDPRYESLPEPLREHESPTPEQAAEAVFAFNRGVIDAVAPLVAAVKPNLAFHEQLGAAGYRVFLETVAYAKEQGLLVIADAKRGDIGSTAEAYARAIFEVAGADAVTLSPWLGEDSLRPFFERAADGRGFFLLVKTSNPSSADIQDLDLGGRTVFEAVADHVSRWGEPHVGERGWSAVGAVVGATFPEQSAALRQRMPRVPFLLPGYGAQGAKAEMLKLVFDADGYGSVVSSSRGVIFAFSKEPYASELGEEGWREAVAAAARAMREDLARVLPDAAWRR